MADHDDEGTATISQEEHRKRLAAKTTRIRELEDALQAMTSERDQLAPAAAKADKLAADLEAARAEVTAAATKAETSVALARAGVTDADAADLVLYRYGRLPEADRPALGDWLGDAARKDALLAAVWGTPAATAAPPAGAAPAAPGQAAAPVNGKPNAAAVSTPAAQPGLTPEALMHLAKTDPKAYLARRDAERAAVGLPPSKLTP